MSFDPRIKSLEIDAPTEQPRLFISLEAHKKPCYFLVKLPASQCMLSVHMRTFRSWLTVCFPCQITPSLALNLQALELGLLCRVYAKAGNLTHLSVSDERLTLRPYRAGATKLSNL